jgi:hypothetical protein
MMPYNNPPSTNTYQSSKKFSEQLSIGKQKEKLKSQRWKMIEDKINAIKS